ncbi:MAG: histidine kinase [Flavobacteriales bacterium]|nr:histidine kinase [Flavobacteriales bacterium]
MKILKSITLLFICFQLNVVAQQLSFKNIKAKNNPYLQFNDIIEYNNNVWFITNEGIYQNKNDQLKKIVQKENLAKFIIVNEKLLVWSIYGEFFTLQGNKLKPLLFNSVVKNQLQNKIINSVVYSENTFYISTVIGGGILKINQSNQEIKTIEVQKSFPYYVVQYGSQLLSGNNSTPTKKQLAINLKTAPFYIPLAENLNSSRTNILQLKDGSFIFTRQYEAIRFNKNKIINRVFIEKNIENIYQSNDGKIWFTLNNGGVVSYPNGNFNSSNSTRYLGNKTVISITQDNKGNMWFGTSGNGVYLLQKDLKINYNAPKIFSTTNNKTEEIKSVSILSEIPSINENSRVLNTTSINNDTIPPVVFINTIKINGVDTTTLTYYELNHNENALEINISGVFGGNSQLQYKYILEGKDIKWNYTTNTNIYYTALKPGNYAFKVYAMNDGGIWSKTPAVITFNIKPPFYTQFWFVFSIIFLILAIILVVIFIITRKNQKQQQLFEEEKRKVLVSELHALRSQMNPHFIFNTLSSIQSFITKNDSKDAVYYLSKFSKLMRATLENTKKQRIPIKDEIESLQLYMDLEKLRLNNKFDYHIIINDEIDTLFEEIPPMLIQPYIENAIWHGISHKTGSGIIKLTFKLENENLLKCEIEDDGVGRKKAREMKKETRKKKSLGMTITKERLEIINSLKDTKLSVNIIDLIDNNIPTGTKIELFIPLD